MSFDLDQLYRWIDEHQITRQKKNLNRDFSDAVPLAEILKKHYPKFVELHNYVPKNAVSQKITNWEILNKKVLNKLKINLSGDEQEQLAKAIPGAIEKLLYKIKIKVDKMSPGDKSGSTSDRIYFLEGISNQESTEGVVPIKIRSGSKTSNQKMVPAEMYNKMERDIADKEEAIVMLKDKVEHFEKMLLVKDERIKDLTQQLQAMVNGNGGDNTSSPRSRFFNRIF